MALLHGLARFCLDSSTATGQKANTRGVGCSSAQSQLTRSFVAALRNRTTRRTRPFFRQWPPCLGPTSPAPWPSQRQWATREP